jgi:hypothetical protein
MTRSTTLRRVLACAGWLVFSGAATSAWAQSSSLFVMPDKAALLMQDVSAVVGAGAAHGVVGALAVNIAAGVDNVQTNQAAVLYGSGAAIVTGQQQTTRSVPVRMGGASATIGSNAFSNTIGVIAVNQAAGANNLQRNAVSVGGLPVGAEAVADNELSATTARNGGTRGRAVDGHALEASIANDAFKGATGVVQVNQSVGAGNATANSFVLRPPAGTFF